MWNTASAQITSDGKYVLSQPIEEGVEVTVTGTFTIAAALKMTHSNMSTLCISFGKLERLN